MKVYKKPDKAPILAAATANIHFETCTISYAFLEVDYDQFLFIPI